jgi:DNA recombination protein RmuC
MQLDCKLWQDAYDVRVLLVSPTQLISALRLVAQLWSHDRQTRNAIEIAKVGGNMYDKFVGFIDDMYKIEKSIKQAHDNYHNAMNKLHEGKGNLMSYAEKMRTLGAKASKSLPDQLKNEIE